MIGYDEDGNEVNLRDVSLKLHGMIKVSGKIASEIFDKMVAFDLIQGTIHGVYFSENSRIASIEIRPYSISVSIEIDNLSREEMIGVIGCVSMPAVRTEEKSKIARDVYLSIREASINQSESFIG